MSYRGHYRSAGRPSEQGIYTDAETAVDFLLKKGLKEKDIILWGRSLGSAAALQTALKYNVRSVIIESGILDIKTAAESVFKRYIKIFHIHLIKDFLIRLIKSSDILQKFDNAEKISEINVPVLIIHAKNDEKINYEQSIELHERNPKTKLIIEENGSHDKTDWAFGYIEEFLKEN